MNSFWKMTFSLGKSVTCTSSKVLYQAAFFVYSFAHSVNRERAMKHGLIFLALLAGAPSSFAQCCGYGMSYDNVVVWPAPDLRVPVPSAIAIKKVEPLRAKAKPAVQANAHLLAQNFPPDKRVEMEKIFVQSMDVYLQIEKKMGWPQRDMAGGLAAFLVGNYMVLKDKEVTDAEFEAVAKQLRAQEKLRDMARKADEAKLRDVFEQTAMIGAFMALAHKSHQQTPQPPAVYENMRNAATENLKLVLRTDPSSLRIDATGMRQ
jgi:hypothetical protein